MDFFYYIFHFQSINIYNNKLTTDKVDIKVSPGIGKQSKVYFVPTLSILICFTATLLHIYSLLVIVNHNNVSFKIRRLSFPAYLYNSISTCECCHGLAGLQIVVILPPAAPHLIVSRQSGQLLMIINRLNRLIAAEMS